MASDHEILCNVVKELYNIVKDSFLSSFKEGCVKTMGFYINKCYPEVDIDYFVKDHECLVCRGEKFLLTFLGSLPAEKEVVIKHLDIWITMYRQFMEESVDHNEYLINDFIRYRDAVCNIISKEGCDKASLFQHRYKELSQMRMHISSIMMNYDAIMSMDEKQYEMFLFQRFAFTCIPDSEIERMKMSPEDILTSLDKNHETCCKRTFSIDHPYVKLQELKKKISDHSQ